MLTKKATRSLLEWNPVPLRIILARFETKFKKTTIIQVYANNPDEDEKEDFYSSLPTVVNDVPKRDILQVTGDLILCRFSPGLTNFLQV